MAFKLAELFVEVGARMPGLSGALGGIKSRLLGLASMGGAIGSQLVSGLAGPLMGLGSLGGLAGAGLAAGLVAGVAAGLIKAARLASDLNETIQKTEQVFGSLTPTVTAAADEMASKFGVVKQEFLDAASMFGLIAQGAGIAGKQSAEMSVSLAKLAADAASFYNLDTDVALEKIRAGLTGESEPLKALGVLLTEDAVKAKALALGLAQPGKELDSQAKVMARYALIQQGLGKAQGDLERTGGGFANQWRAFTGQLTNLGTAIGQIVLPAFTLLLRAVNKALTAISTTFDTLKESWSSFLTFIGAGESPTDQAAHALELAEIDKRNQAMADAQAAEQNAALKGKGHKETKGSFSGLEEFAKKIAEGAAGGKDALAKKHVQIAQQQLNVERDQLAAMKTPRRENMIAIAK